MLLLFKPENTPFIQGEELVHILTSFLFSSIWVNVQNNENSLKKDYPQKVFGFQSEQEVKSFIKLQALRMGESIQPPFS